MWLVSIALSVGISSARAVHQRAGGRFTAIDDFEILRAMDWPETGDSPAHHESVSRITRLFPSRR
jgi:hypothetical protein